METESLVRRDAELAEARRLLRKPSAEQAELIDEQAELIDLVGGHGTGKNELIRQVAKIAHDEDIPVFTANFLNYTLGGDFHVDRGQGTDVDVLRDTFKWSRELLSRWAEEAKYIATYTAKEKLAEFCDQCRNASTALTGVATQPDATDVSLKETIKEHQLSLDNMFVHSWTMLAEQRGALVAVQNFDQVVGTALGQWFLQLARQLRHTVVIIARVPTKGEAKTLAHAAHVWKLRNFTVEEVEKYLDSYFAPGKVGAKVAAVVHWFTGGHAGGVTLTGALLNETGYRELDPEDLRRTFNRLSGEPATKWAKLVKAILDVADEPVLLEAVNAASVVRSFDGPLLAHLLEATDQGSQANVKNVIDRLEGCDIVERVVVNGEPSAQYRLREFIRQSVSRNLRANKAGEKLHASAAAYYYQQLGDEPATATYSGWFQYEDPVWQLNKREWLYHSAQVQEVPELARLRFSLVFLEAFWWWGCYHPFPMLDQLLEDWRRYAAVARPAGRPGTQPQAVQGPEHERQLDEELASAFGFVLDNYPTAYEKADAPWDAIQTQLLLIERVCGLAPGARGRTVRMREASARRVEGLLRIFLAHTRRFRDPSDPLADRDYTLAAQAFADRDQWTLAWLEFERADLEVERGHTEAAAKLVARSAGILRSLVEKQDDDWDNELLANLHRVLADAHWAREEITEAFEEYSAAVLHGYLFQGQPCPDSYTQRFYREMTTRIAARLRELSGRGRAAEALAFATRLRQALPAAAPPVDGALLETGEVEALRAAVFPPGPELAELGLDHSAFMDRLAVFRDELPDPEPDLSRLTAAAPGPDPD
jgi:hypothetical protein